MRIMLIQDVAPLGQVGDVVEVKNGYARNYLIPQKMAVIATAGALKQAEQFRASADKRRARERSAAEAQAQRLSGQSFRFERKVGENGRLYGSVTSADIADALTAKLGEEFDRRKVQLSEPIKTLGDFDVPLDIHADVPVSVHVTVVGENGETAADFANVDSSVSPFDELAEGEEPTQPDMDY